MAITLIQAALHISGFRIHGFNQLWIKYIQKVPKIKTCICRTSAAIYILFMLHYALQGT